MKLKNKEIRYIPNLMNEKSFGIDQYVISEKEAKLYFDLKQVSASIERLLDQYPMSVEKEEIERFLDYHFAYAKKAGVNPDYCYHYYGKEGDISQGIIVDLPRYPAFIPMKITTTEFYGNEPMYQRRVDLIYDKTYEEYMLNKFVEVSKENGVVVQSSFPPKILKKIRKTIKY